MLIDFAVSNFRSIRDRQHLSMFRSLRTRREAERAAAPWKRIDLAPVVAIYGPNASGKTSFVDALAYVKNAVEDSYARWKPDAGIRRPAFLLDLEHRAEPTEFDIEFVGEDGLDYRYGFSVNDEVVLEEYLYVYRTKRRTTLFERTRQKYRFGDSFRGPASLLKDTTRGNALFLSAAAAADLEATQVAYKWLTNTLSAYSGPNFRGEHLTVKSKLQSDTSYRERLIDYISRFDLGVTSVDLIREEIDPEEREDLRRLVEEHADSSLKLDDVLRSVETELSLSHRGVDGSYTLPFSTESDGTQALISFSSLAIRALDHGSVCVVDEIDASLHPSIVNELIGIFSDPRVNKNQAQLIVTTHDVSLLRPESHLEVDAVRVVTKDTEGASSMVSINDIGLPRKDENLERGYLTGRYGGLPYTKLLTEMIAKQLVSSRADG